MKNKQKEDFVWYEDYNQFKDVEMTIEKISPKKEIVNISNDDLLHIRLKDKNRDRAYGISARAIKALFIESFRWLE